MNNRTQDLKDLINFMKTFKDFNDDTSNLVVNLMKITINSCMIPKKTQM